MRKNGKILVVDDSQSIRDVLRKFLEQKGFEILSAVDAFEAADLLGSNDVILIITDIYMPNKTGFDFLEEIRSNGSHAIPVIVITGFPTAETVETAASLKVKHFLLKPINFNRLTTAVEDALGEESPLPKMDDVSFSGYKALVLSHDSKELRKVSSILNEQGVNVTVAESWLDGTGIIKKTLPHFVFIGDRLEDADGDAVLRGISRRADLGTVVTVRVKSGGLTGERLGKFSFLLNAGDVSAIQVKRMLRLGRAAINRARSMESI